MCGLFGVAGKILAAEMDVFERLALVSVFRGSHSTGIATVSKTNEVSVFKKPVPTYDFFEMSRTKAMLQFPYSLKCIIGHARYATVGEKTAANAHPFEFDNIVGVHNGTIDRGCITGYLEKDTPKYGTDSEAMFHKLNENTFEDVIPNLSGAWAITAWDKNNQILRVLRNSKRDLYCISSDGGDTLFWASEKSMLEFAIRNTGYKAKLKKDSEELDIRFFAEDCLYTVSDGVITNVKKNVLSTKTYAVATVYPPYSGGSYYGAAHGSSVSTNKNVLRYGDHNKDALNNSSLIIPPIPRANAETISAMIAPILDNVSGIKLHKSADYKLFDNATFLKDYEQECQLCGGAIDFDTGMLITNDAPLHPICHHCVEKEPELLKLVEMI